MIIFESILVECCRLFVQQSNHADLFIDRCFLTGRYQVLDLS
jgi:hypothetical protein